MNWLDFVLVFLVVISIVASFRKCFSRELIGLIAVIAALFCGVWFYGSAGAFLIPYVSSKEVANFCGFILIFTGVLIAGAIVGHLFGRLVKAAGLTMFDRFLGAGFGLVRGLLFAVALILAIVAFAPGRPGDGPPRAVVQSRFAPYVIDTAHLFASLAPRELKDGFQKHYGQVKSVWEEMLKKGIHKSDSEV
jgi:membrane protein required for colicin V production